MITIDEVPFKGSQSLYPASTLFNEPKTKITASNGQGHWANGIKRSLQSATLKYKVKQRQTENWFLKSHFAPNNHCFTQRISFLNVSHSSSKWIDYLLIRLLYLYVAAHATAVIGKPLLCRYILSHTLPGQRHFFKDDGQCGYESVFLLLKRNLCKEI